MNILYTILPIYSTVILIYAYVQRTNLVHCTSNESDLHITKQKAPLDSPVCYAVHFIECQEGYIAFSFSNHSSPWEICIEEGLWAGPDDFWGSTLNDCVPPFCRNNTHTHFHSIGNIYRNIRFTASSSISSIGKIQAHGTPLAESSSC